MHQCDKPSQNDCDRDDKAKPEPREKPIKDGARFQAMNAVLSASVA
jgi:hypothetical protein